MIDLADEALQAFIEESREHVAALEQGLLALESADGAADTATINTVFRAAHTIKGGAGFFALTPVQRLSHGMEDALGKLRAGELRATPAVISALLETTTLLARMIADLTAADAVEYADALERLTQAGTVFASPVPTDEAITSAPGAEHRFLPAPPPEGTPAMGTPAVSRLELRGLDGTAIFLLEARTVADAQHRERGGRFVHFVEIDPSALAALENVAALIEQQPAVTRDGEPPRIHVACATVLHADVLAELLGVDPSRVKVATDVLLREPEPPPAPALRAHEVIKVPPLPAIRMAAPEPPLPMTITPATRVASRGEASPPPPPSLRSSGAMSGRHSAEAQGTIRVNVTQLDRLMTLAGELVLTRNALLKKASERDLDEMIELSERVDAITSELQDGIMATRMQPVGIVFTKFRRIVRDLAVMLGKRIDLEIEGEEVELDKTIIEAIGDPLTHLVRNSADHGLESPSARASAGKPDAGKVSLRAYHEAGQVVIEVADDGRGIDPERIAQKALEQRLRTRDQIEVMSEEEKVRLIFEPGFSTAAQVTEVSGRGVGMDVVASSITKVGGSVDIRSVVGRGTTMLVRLPLTLAIIPSILVAAGDERFAIPQVNLVELTRIPAREVHKRVERVGSAQVMRLRGELLPLLRLSEALGTTPMAPSTSGEPRPDRRRDIADRRQEDQGPPEGVPERRSGFDRRAGAVNVAVVSANNLRYGLVVDQLLDSEEIVVKPLGVHLAGAREYAGATILGDGTVALILDVAGLGAAQNLAATKAMIENVEARRRATSSADDVHTYLVFENGKDERFAVPLRLVSRIERRPESAVVTAGGRPTVTVGQGLLGLVSIEDVAKVGARARGKHFYAIVCRAWGREVGLMASRIVDVIEAASEIDPATHVQPGILGSTVVDGQVMLLVDVHGLVDAVLPEYRKKPVAAAAEEAPLLLVVEDSPFFRKQIVTCLHEAGYRTIAAEDGQEGLSLLAQHPEVSLVVSDLEMPNMDGLEMTRRIRAGGQVGLPIFAVTSVSGDAAERRGREAGITEYMIKLDRDHLVERTNHYLKGARAAAIEGPSRRTPMMMKGAFG
jgi:two-component system chemotaxis sensor kinase CheA